MKSIIRLEPSGPSGAGLEDMELDPEDFQSGLPQQKIHVYYEDAALGLTVGVWTTTDMQEAFGPYPGDEFMWILEGQVSMVDGSGGEVLVREGESFCLRNAIPISWKQVGFLRKFYMTYAKPDAPVPEIESADGGVIILRANELIAGLETVTDSETRQRDNVVFTNDAGNMTAGMWESEAFETTMSPFSVHEFAQILEGHATLTEADGTVHEFSAGDAFFIPCGTVCQWKTTDTIRKFYACLDPA